MSRWASKSRGGALGEEGGGGLVFAHEGYVALQVVAQLAALAGHVLEDVVELREDRAEQARPGHEEEDAEDLREGFGKGDENDGSGVRKTLTINSLLV